MLTMTPTAGAYLVRKLDNQQAGADAAVRFIRKPKRHGWVIRVEDRLPDDVTLAHAGRTVLLVDEPTSQLLTNRVLDVQDTDEGPQLRFRKAWPQK